MTGGNWESVPGWIKEKIWQEHEIEALAWMLGKDIREGKATDAEMAASLYCASLVAPMDHNAGQIYLFICTRLLEEKGWTVPSDIRVTELTSDQERELRDWRYELYRHRGKASTPMTRAIKEVFGNRRKTKNPQPVSQPEAAQTELHMQEAKV